MERATKAPNERLREAPVQSRKRPFYFRLSEVDFSGEISASEVWRTRTRPLLSLKGDNTFRGQIRSKVHVFFFFFFFNSIYIPVDQRHPRT